MQKSVLGHILSYQQVCSIDILIFPAAGIVVRSCFLSSGAPLNLAGELIFRDDYCFSDIRNP